MMKYIITLLASLISLSGCDSSSRIYGTVRIPVIEECKSHLVKRLEKDEWKRSINWTIDKFTALLSTEQYPNLSGVLTINGLTKEFNKKAIMERMINHVLLDCYPTTSTEFNISDMGGEFKKTLSLIRRYEKPKQEYIILKNDKVIMRFRGKRGVNK